MSKKKPIKINLLPKDPFLDSILGRSLNWAFHIGRYIVIFTELMVILSFAARFNLDRQITDLNESIHQKKTIIESYGELEDQIRLAQAKIENYQQVEDQDNIVELFPKIQAIVPKNLQLTELRFGRDSVYLEAIALSNTALNLFINNLQLSEDFYEVSVEKIENREENAPGFYVQIHAQTFQGIRFKQATKQTKKK